jgi:hypothetical protein
LDFRWGVCPDICNLVFLDVRYSVVTRDLVCFPQKILTLHFFSRNRSVFQDIRRLVFTGINGVVGGLRPLLTLHLMCVISKND